MPKIAKKPSRSKLVKKLDTVKQCGQQWILYLYYLR